MKASEVPIQDRLRIKDFQRQNLRGKSFKGQDLSGADFSEADLRGTNFTGANLQGAKFVRKLLDTTDEIYRKILKFILYRVDIQKVSA